MTGENVASPTGITTKISPRSVPDTVAMLTELLTAKGLRVFVVIDQADAAREVGLSLRPTVLVLFGAPAAGTPLMDAVPLSGLDLPLKVLIWLDGQETKVSYLSPDALAARYQLDDALARNLAGIDPLTDALVSR